MTPSEARTTLLAQHERLRSLLKQCTRLAKLHRAGETVVDQLDAVLARLCDEVAAHNRTEIGIIGDLASGPASWGSWSIDELFQEQVAAHAAFWSVLRATPAEEPDRILALAQELDSHMAEEERTFLQLPTMCDDVQSRALAS